MIAHRVSDDLPSLTGASQGEVNYTALDCEPLKDSVHNQARTLYFEKRERRLAQNL